MKDKDAKIARKSIIQPVKWADEIEANLSGMSHQYEQSMQITDHDHQTTSLGQSAISKLSQLLHMADSVFDRQQVDEPSYAKFRDTAFVV